MASARSGQRPSTLFRSFCASPSASRVLAGSTFMSAPPPEAHAHLHVLEARGGRALRRAHGLARLALAAVGRAPDLPVGFVAHRVARIPEARRDAGVGAVLEHGAQLAV